MKNNDNDAKIVLLALLAMGACVFFIFGFFVYRAASEIDISRQATVIYEGQEVAINDGRGELPQTLTSTEIPKHGIDLLYNGFPLRDGKNFNTEIYVNGDTGVVLLKGINKNSGTVELTYKIKPSKLQNVSVTAATTTANVSWKVKDSTASGFYIYEDLGNELKEVKKVDGDKTDCEIQGLSPCTEYSFKVVPFNKNGSNKDYKSVGCKTTPKKIKIKVSETNNDTYLVKWSDIKCDGIYVFYLKSLEDKDKGVVHIEAPADGGVEIPKKNTNFIYATAYSTYAGKNSFGKSSDTVCTSYSKEYASYSTNYVNNQDRTNNLNIACKAIDGTVVLPGETFSFNEVVGKRTTAKGYKAAHIFINPTKTEMGVGGGVCQVASTLYNTALLANFNIVERHQHSQRVSYVPLGRDAAIYWNGTDLKFANTSKYPIKIKMNCKNGSINAAFLVNKSASRAPSVNISVSQSGKNFVLTRTVKGKENYSSYSYY